MIGGDETQLNLNGPDDLYVVPIMGLLEKRCYTVPFNSYEKDLDSLLKCPWWPSKGCNIFPQYEHLS